MSSSELELQQLRQHSRLYDGIVKHAPFLQKKGWKDDADKELDLFQQYVDFVNGMNPNVPLDDTDIQTLETMLEHLANMNDDDPTPHIALRYWMSQNWHDHEKQRQKSLRSGFISDYMNDFRDRNVEKWKASIFIDSCVGALLNAHKRQFYDRIEMLDSVVDSFLLC
jgi:hypothetical protein